MKNSWRWTSNTTVGGKCSAFDRFVQDCNQLDVLMDCTHLDALTDCTHLDALADCTRLNALTDYTQSDALTHCTQLDALMDCTQFDTLTDSTQLDALTDYTQLVALSWMHSQIALSWMISWSLPGLSKQAGSRCISPSTLINVPVSLNACSSILSLGKWKLENSLLLFQSLLLLSIFFTILVFTFLSATSTSTLIFCHLTFFFSL